MLQDLRKHQAKTRQAFLLINRIEAMETQIARLLKDENQEFKSFESTLKKNIKGKPNHLQIESQKIIDEVKELRAGKLQRYLKGLENTTKSKK